MPRYASDVEAPRLVAATEIEIAGKILTESEFEALDGITAGTVSASKALVVDSNKDLATLRHLTISGNFVTGSTTLSETDLAKIDGITNGTQAAGKAVVADANVNTGVSKVTQLHIGATGSETQVTATAAEINNACDVSTQLVAAGASLTLTAASHANRTIALDTAAGSTITLPAASGSGAVFRFLVTVKPTSNQHRINVVGDDAFYGSVNILDADASAQAAFTAGSDADQFDLNGTTKGGLKGDWVEIVDFVADGWAIFGQLVCPAGSNPATPFATGQVS